MAGDSAVWLCLFACCQAVQETETFVKIWGDGARADTGNSALLGSSTRALYRGMCVGMIELQTRLPCMPPLPPFPNSHDALHFSWAEKVSTPDWLVKSNIAHTQGGRIVLRTNGKVS